MWEMHELNVIIYGHELILVTRDQPIWSYRYRLSCLDSYQTDTDIVIYCIGIGYTNLADYQSIPNGDP